MPDRQTLHKENIYHIRVEGNLDEKWADWFEGFVMASRGNGETLLSGAVADQAALHGALGRIHSLGLPLRLVVQTACPCSKKSCPRHGHCHECTAHHGAQGGLPVCFRAKSKWDKQCMVLTKAL